MKKFCNVLFVLFLLGCLLLGLTRTVVFPKDINYYENRYASKIDAPSLSGYADGSFQDSLEDALSDQVPFAERLKKFFNLSSSYMTLELLKPCVEPEHYFKLGSVALFSDYLVLPMRNLEEIAPALDERADNLNQIFSAHPETDFYVYYIEKDYDNQFETGEQLHADDYLFSELSLPESRKGRFAISDFSEFSEYFYQTDHHWNYKGSYKAYCELLPFLGCDDAPLSPTGTREIGDFSGSKAAGTGIEGFHEMFSAYEFEFPKMDILYNGEPVADYGLQSSEYPADKVVSYGTFYGDDAGELVFDTHQDERENLLILGDSNDNAIVKLLASHFHRTHAVDLRNYEKFLGKPFALRSYLEENHISKVLLIGINSYFTSSDFALED